MARYARTGQEAAFFLLRAFTLKPPINVEFLAMESRARVHYADFPDDISGSLLIEEGKISIFINRNHSSNRQRFTLAHEVIHLYCGHGTAFCQNGVKTWIERQANIGAAELLMPASYVRTHAFFYRYDIQRLADRYVVSREAMRFRLIELGLWDREMDKPIPRPLDSDENPWAI